MKPMVVLLSDVDLVRSMLVVLLEHRELIAAEDPEAFEEYLGHVREFLGRLQAAAPPRDELRAIDWTNVPL